jgi:hypothetical protein
MKEKFYAKSVTVAKQTDKIKACAEKVGIILPSTHTALFQSIYAPINEANANGVRLARKAVEESLPKIIGSQCNLEHMGYGWIVGIILDSWINDNDEIEIIYSFAKNIYKDEYTAALEAMSNGDLAVSFELMAETDSQEKLADSTILLHEIDFQGVGMLITHPPAYEKAKTYAFASAIKNRIAESENKELVFASKIEDTCNTILSDIEKSENKISKDERGNSKVTEEQKRQIEALRAELGDVAKDVKDEELLDETKVAELRVKFVAYKSDTVEIRTYSVVSNDGKDTIEETVQRLTKTDYNALQEAQAKVTELQSENETLKATLTAKDSEIEVVRVNAEKIGKSKVELKDNEFAAEFKDEDYLDEAKIASAIQAKKDKEVIAQRKEELKENTYAKDFKDEDYLNSDKVELAKVKAEKDELKAKVSTEPITAAIETTEKVVLKAGAEEKEGTEEKKTEEVMASIRKQTKETKEDGYKVRIKK